MPPPTVSTPFSTLLSNQPIAPLPPFQSVTQLHHATDKLQQQKATLGIMEQLQATQNALQALQQQVDGKGQKGSYKGGGKGLTSKGSGKGGKAIAWVCRFCNTGHHNGNCWTCRNWDCM